MSEHFLLSRAAKTLNLMQVMRMTDAEARTWLARVGWRQHGLVGFGEVPRGAPG